MADWSSHNITLTAKGASALSKVQAGSGSLTITRVIASEQYLAESTLREVTSLSVENLPLTIIDRHEVQDGGSVIQVQLSNLYLGNAFTLNEIGVFATHSDNPSEEFLYIIAQVDADTGDKIPVYATTPVTATYDIYLYNVGADNIEITISSAGLVTYEALNKACDIIQRNTAYEVEDILHSPSLKKGLAIKCTVAGITKSTDTDLSHKNVGDTVEDGTSQWVVIAPSTTADFDAHNHSLDAHPELVALLMESSGINVIKRSHEYAKGDIAYSDKIPSWAFLECIVAGTTSDGWYFPEPSEIKVGDTIVDYTVTWKVRKVTNTTEATQTTSGLMSATDKKAVDDIPSTYIKELSISGTKLTVKKGDNTTTTLNTQDTNTTYDPATQSANGLMSAADKKKLDGIAAGANAYSHPTTSGNKHIPSGGSSGQILRWSADGTATWGADTASKLATPRKIELTGNVTGSANFDGTSDVNINVMVNSATKANTASSVAWSGVTGKPGTYPPSTHNHDSAYPSVTGTRASGTWGINVSGNSATATNATTAQVANKVNITNGNEIVFNRNGQNNGGDVWLGYRNEGATNPITTYRFGDGLARDGLANISAKTFVGNLSGNADTATNADKLDGYHYPDIVTKIQGKTTPTMTALVDWAAMTTACNLRPATVSVSTVVDGSSVTLSVPSIKNLRNISTGIMAYSGDNDSGSLTGTNRPFYKGDIILKQSYKNFDKILIVFCNDDSNFICHKIWEKWELEYAFDHSYRFSLFETNGIHWWFYGTKKQGTVTNQRLSTDTFWRCSEQNSGIVEIYGLKY